MSETPMEWAERVGMADPAHRDLLVERIVNGINARRLWWSKDPPRIYSDRRRMAVGPSVLDEVKALCRTAAWGEQRIERR